jgi:hypothetical protein
MMNFEFNKIWKKMAVHAQPCPRLGINKKNKYKISTILNIIT